MSFGGTTAGIEARGLAHPVPENAAWARVDIPLSAKDTFTFLEDTERLFRLNPHLEISEWHEQRGMLRGCKFNALNETNGCRYEVMIGVEAFRKNQSITLRYDRGLKFSTEFRVAPAYGGSSLTIVEHYHPVNNQDDERLKEVDRSLVPWLAAIRGHIAGLARYRWLPGYRWWAGRFMLEMPPQQRRIVRMIIWASLLEFILFLLVAAIFWLERQGG